MPEEEKTLPKESPSPQPIIWVVDDEEVLRQLTPRMLEVSGLPVASVFPDGKECFQEIQAAIQNGEKLPDVIVSDFNMPKMSGEELLEKTQTLCKENGKKPPTFIIVSGNLDREKEERLKKTGAFVCLPKPFEIPELKEAVQKAVEEHSRKEKAAS